MQTILKVCLSCQQPNMASNREILKQQWQNQFSEHALKIYFLTSIADQQPDLGQLLFKVFLINWILFIQPKRDYFQLSVHLHWKDKKITSLLL